MTQEPRVIHATVCDIDGAGDAMWDIVCRFSDGQEFVAVQVERPFENLAQDIAKYLSSTAEQDTWSWQFLVDGRGAGPVRASWKAAARDAVNAEYAVWIDNGLRIRLDSNMGAEVHKLKRG